MDGDNSETDYAGLLTEQQAARNAVADLPLDHVYEHPRYGAMSLRWVYLHMIGEYAGHAAHAALLREAVDGVTFGQIPGHTPPSSGRGGNDGATGGPVIACTLRNSPPHNPVRR